MSSFQIKTVGDYCNIRCTYCRNRDFDQNRDIVMSLDILKRIFVFLNSLPQDKIRINWNGGEPLLAGKDFFCHIIKLEKQHTNKKWVNMIQTNAMLIDDDWAKFFFDNDFRVGVSIDGNKETHNRNRISISNNGTYEKAMCGVDTLRTHNIYPSTICTVTKKTATYAKEIFRGLIEGGFKNLSFNAFYNTASEHSEDIYGLTDKEWLNFLIEVFDEWLILNNPTIRVREIDSILAWIKSKSANSCEYKGTCHQWFSIDQTGEIYPCERYGKTIRFGNINSCETFSDITTSSIFTEWEKNIETLPQKCQSCSLQSLCNNGCSRHRESDVDGVSLYTYCESRLGFYYYIQQKLNREEVSNNAN
jgi:uncharacterized protein